MRLEDIVVGWNLDLTGLKKGMSGAKTQIDSFDKRFSAATAKLSNKWTGLVGTIGTIALFKKALDSTIEFEKGLSGVASLVDADMRPAIFGMKEDLQNLMIQYGETGKATTNALYKLQSFGFEGRDALKVLEVAMKGATAGATDVDTSTNALIQTMKAYGLSADEALKASDSLFLAVKRGGTDFTALASNVAKVAPTAAAAGIKMEEMNAALATLTAVGGTTEEAVVGLRGVIDTFLKSEEKSVEAAAKFGIELSSQTLKTEGLTGVMKKLEGATADQVAGIFRESQARTAVLKLMSATEEQVRNLDEQLTTSGATQSAYAVNADTTAQAIKRFNAAVEVFGERATQWFLEPLTKVIEIFTNLDFIISGSIITLKEWSQKVAHFFGEMVADIAGFMGKLPGKLGAPFREVEAEFRKTMERQKKNLENLRVVWNEEVDKRIGLVQEELDANMKKDGAIADSAKKTTGKLGDEQEKRTKKTKKELQKEIDAAIKKDNELLARTVNRAEAQAIIEGDYWRQRLELEHKLVLTGDREIKEQLEELDLIYAERFKNANEDMFEFVSKLDQARAKEHGEVLDEMSAKEQAVAAKQKGDLAGVAQGHSNVANAATTAGKQVVGSMQEQAVHIRKVREEFQAYADQVVAMKYFDIRGIGATGGYVDTEGVEFTTLGGITELSQTFLANMERYSQSLAEWVKGGRSGKAPAPPSTAGISQLSGASLKDIKNVPPEVYEAQETLNKLLTYNTNDWLREYGLLDTTQSGQGGGSSNRGGGTTSIMNEISTPGRGTRSMGMAPPIGPVPFQDAVPIQADKVVNNYSNQYTFNFTAPEAFVKDDLQKWVVDKIIPVLNQLAANGRIPWVSNKQNPSFS